MRPGELREHPSFSSLDTVKLPRVDEKLIAAARAARASAPKVVIEELDDASLVDDEEVVSERHVSLVEPVDAETVVRLSMGARELVALPLNRRTGFLLSLVDGHRSVHALIELSGLPEAEVVAIVDELLALGAVARV